MDLGLPRDDPALKILHLRRRIRRTLVDPNKFDAASLRSDAALWKANAAPLVNAVGWYQKITNGQSWPVER
jgi:hypothetical protein